MCKRISNPFFSPFIRLPPYSTISSLSVSLLFFFFFCSHHFASACEFPISNIYISEMLNAIRIFDGSKQSRWPWLGLSVCPISHQNNYSKLQSIEIRCQIMWKPMTKLAIPLPLTSIKHEIFLTKCSIQWIQLKTNKHQRVINPQCWSWKKILMGKWVYCIHVTAVEAKSSTIYMQH